MKAMSPKDWQLYPMALLKKEHPLRDLAMRGPTLTAAAPMKESALKETKKTLTLWKIPVKFSYLQQNLTTW